MGAEKSPGEESFGTRCCCTWPGAFATHMGAKPRRATATDSKNLFNGLAWNMEALPHRAAPWAVKPEPDPFCAQTR